MSSRNGFAIITIVIIVASALVASSGGYTGVRYYQSEKFKQEADGLFGAGRYDEAIALYEKSLSRWQKAEVKDKHGLAIKEKNISSSLEELRKNLAQVGWQKCVNRLDDIPADSMSYSEAQSITRDCQARLDEEAAKKKAEDEAAASSAASNTKKEIAASNTGQETATPAASTSSNTSSATSSTPSASAAEESNSDTSSTSSTTNTDSSTSDNSNPSTPATPVPTCQNNTSPTFTSHLTDTSKIIDIPIPPRMMSGHLKTHSYLNTNGERVPVYAPTAMKLKGGVHLSHGSDPDDYGMDFEVSCEIMLRVGHITDPIQSIKDTFPTAQESSVTDYDITPINFIAGDLLGHTTGTAAAGNWDFGVYNSSTRNRYADDPTWNTSSIYTTAVCPYDFFSSSLKSEYSSKYIQDFGVSTHDGVFFCQ